MKKLILLAFILSATTVAQAKEEKACPYRSAAGLFAKTNEKPVSGTAVRPAPAQKVRTQR
jgi:hypothetical protein